MGLKGKQSREEPAPDLSEEIRRNVLDAGFDRVGFARAGPAPHAEHLEEWLRRGYAATMDYMGRTAERRTRPDQVVPGAQSMIVVALHYGSDSATERSCGSREESDELAATGQGEIARYARGTDYHLVMEKRLKALCRSLGSRFPAERFRYYVDTGPVLERGWAQEAGLGWIGKNACAIDPESGSYFFIGVIITTLPLHPDEPAADQCGSCRICLDACPTGAIVEPYRVDARLCVSYLTIEHRGAIEEKLRTFLGGMVFGCDICQEACPFNRPANLSRDPGIAPRPENGRMALEELLLLNRETFARRFPRSAVRRAKVEGLVRNALIAAGNSGRADFLPLLDRLGRTQEITRDPTLSEALSWAKARLRGESPPGAAPAPPGPARYDRPGDSARSSDR